MQSHDSEAIWKNIENDTVPIIVLRIFEEEGRTSRNIGNVGHKEVGGRNGGQERCHSVEVLRNCGIVGILGVEGLEGSYGGDIDGQTVLEKEVLTESVDENSLIDKAFATILFGDRTSHFMSEFFH